MVSAPSDKIWYLLHNSTGVFWVRVKALRPVSNVVLLGTCRLLDDYDNEFEIFSVLSGARA